uniref:Uncharacterized protein n=1 Tax=Hyaloperonospora arabidopsidis (strain Emoy2) TaxID=559515 RepID=M4B820_HYAAE
MEAWSRQHGPLIGPPRCLIKIKGKEGKEMIGSFAVYRKMKAASYHKRYALCSLAHGTGASASKLCRMRQRSDIIATAIAIKLLLMEENKRSRIAFISRFFDELTLLYYPMYDMIHLDEKRFYMTRESQQIYLCPNESAPRWYVRVPFNISTGAECYYE